ncbi:MAG TPA: 50S ribosomal protein L22 [Chloroflexota bacterium]|nr:50S ribosomal protein L22 [Chloroflexota bacterium]
MEVRAVAKQIRISPRKARLVGNAIKGMGVREAMAALQLIPNKAGDPIYKAVKSAAANAENNYNLSTEDLVVARVLADPGRSLKRWRARARGRAASIISRSSHITVVVTEREA